jgi:3-hydroxybutyryl-CoA dehydrogenase
MDLAGLDTVEKVSGVVMPALDRSTGVPTTISALVADGALGVKAERGFYTWDADSIAETVAARDETVRLLSDRRAAR